MAANVPGIEAYIGMEKVFAVDGRRPPTEQVEAAAAGKMLPGWTPAQNGFCLLTDQPMPLKESIFEETPGSYGSPALFGFSGSEAVAVPGDQAAAPSPLAAYRKHIAEAAKVAFPEAEYVWVRGHNTFSAEVSPLRQVRVLLCAAMSGMLTRLLSKVFPSCVPAKAEGNKTPATPAFGATQFLHVDASAELGAKWYTEIISSNNVEDGNPYARHKMRLPGAFVSGASKRRRLVVANFWRNVRADASIKNDHLAVVDAQTVTEAELHAAKFKNVAIGGQEQYHMKVKNHRLVYFPDMAQSEILVFKQGAYDVEQGAAEGQYSVTPASELQKNFIFHTSINDPRAPKDVPRRKAVVCAAVIIVMPETQK